MSVRPAIFAGLMLVVAGGGCASQPVPPAGGSAQVKSIDPKWTEYRAYLEKWIAAVQVEWEGLLGEMSTLPPSGSHVTVTFRLDRQGRVAEIVSVDTDAGEPAAKACVEAITLRMPGRAWTDTMVAALGESQELTFTFYYQ